MRGHLLIAAAIALLLAFGFMFMMHRYEGPMPPIVRAQRYCWRAFPGSDQGEQQRLCIIEKTRLFKLGEKDVER